MIVYLDGAFVSQADIQLSPTDRGLTLGDGVFDTLLAVEGEPQQAPLHFGRLRDHAAILRIFLPASPEALTAAARDILQKNNFGQGRHAIRTTVTRGPGARGLAPPDNPTPTLLMQATPLPDLAALPPVHAIIAQTTRRNQQSPLSRIKSLQYADNLLALLEARDHGANEAILLNTAGHVACATTSNIFILEKNRLLTPPLSDGAMDGITRRHLLMKHNAAEETITPVRLRAAEAIILTNSIHGVRSVAQLEGRLRAAPPSMPD